MTYLQLYEVDETLERAREIVNKGPDNLETLLSGVLGIDVECREYRVCRDPVRAPANRPWTPTGPRLNMLYLETDDWTIGLKFWLQEDKELSIQWPQSTGGYNKYLLGRSAYEFLAGHCIARLSPILDQYPETVLSLSRDLFASQPSAFGVVREGFFNPNLYFRQLMIHYPLDPHKERVQVLLEGSEWLRRRIEV